MTTEFDPNTYVSKTVHGGVREIVGEEAEKIRARLEMSPERMIEALNNQVRIITNERDALKVVLKKSDDVLALAFNICILTSAEDNQLTHDIEKMRGEIGKVLK